VIVLIPSIEVG